MFKFKITNYNKVGDYQIISDKHWDTTARGKKRIKSYNEFTVLAASRADAIKIADALLGHTNYALPFEGEV